LKAKSRWAVLLSARQKFTSFIKGPPHSHSSRCDCRFPYTKFPPSCRDDSAMTMKGSAALLLAGGAVVQGFAPGMMIPNSCGISSARGISGVGASGALLGREGLTLRAPGGRVDGGRNLVRLEAAKKKGGGGKGNGKGKVIRTTPGILGCRPRFPHIFNVSSSVCVCVCVCVSLSLRAPGTRRWRWGGARQARGSTGRRPGCCKGGCDGGGEHEPPR
jgi:hypothetical protein